MTDVLVDSNMRQLTDMTIDDLRAFILQVLQEQNILVQPAHQSRCLRLLQSQSLNEVLDSIDHWMGTPPAGSKSGLELLREDRDR
jgi:ribosomal protein L12E/L44/L45/RPP1/RPP2